MAGTPWMKWFPSDWRGDAKVRACSPIARYVWMEMLGLMHEADPYGHLIHVNRAMDLGTLSRLIGVDQVDVKRAVKELEANRVFSRTDEGVIFSRRMLRDKDKSETAKNRGSKGGNPALKKQRLMQSEDNLEDNHDEENRDKPQKPEAREKETPHRVSFSEADGGKVRAATARDGLLDGKPPPRASAAEGAAPPAPSPEPLALPPRFPADGSILGTPWAAAVRQMAPRADPDLVAQRFRDAMRVSEVEFDDPDIRDEFLDFCGEALRRRA